MVSYKEVYDISVFLGGEAVTYPGDPSFSREMFSKLEDGKAYNGSRLTMSGHAGTHIDTPAHFILGAKNLDQFPVEKWILPATVVNIKDKEAIRPAELEGVDVKPGEALLFKTANSLLGRNTSGVFSTDFVYVSAEAADFCVAKKLALVGIDYGTVDKVGVAQAHHKMLGSGLLLLEGINLKAVPPGRYTLVCPPIKIKGADGAPTRAFLMR